MPEEYTSRWKPEAGVWVLAKIERAANGIDDDEELVPRHAVPEHIDVSASALRDLFLRR